jgi:Cd2+/Zn2+-exporting ATPase
MKYKLTKKQKKMLRRIIIASVLLAVCAVVSHFVVLPWWAKLIIFVIPYLIAGYDVLKSAAVNLIHGRVFDEKFLMMVATIILAAALWIMDYAFQHLMTLIYTL